MVAPSKLTDNCIAAFSRGSCHSGADMRVLCFLPRTRVRGSWLPGPSSLPAACLFLVRSSLKTLFCKQLQQEHEQEQVKLLGPAKSELGNQVKYGVVWESVWICFNGLAKLLRPSSRSV